MHLLCLPPLLTGPDPSFLSPVPELGRAMGKEDEVPFVAPSFSPWTSSVPIMCADHPTVFIFVLACRCSRQVLRRKTADRVSEFVGPLLLCQSHLHLFLPPYDLTLSHPLSPTYILYSSQTRPAPEYDARSPAARAPSSAPSPSASANAHPTKPSAIDQTSPYHPSSTSSRTRKTSTQAAGADVSGETILEPVRATLGFLPPANERGGVSTVRRRKVRRGREAKMMGVDTADGDAA
jgi:hypothetical protein